MICDLTWNDTASRAANATISAHETTPGHSSSSFDFISSIISYPDIDPFGGAAFSAVLFWVESNRIDASQPYMHICQKSVITIMLSSPICIYVKNQ